MSLVYNDLLKLAKTVAQADPAKPTAYSFNEKTYSYDDMNEALRTEFSALAGDYYDYQANKLTIFKLLAETFDDILPKKVLEQFGQFADVKSFAQGDKPIFIQKTSNASKRRAKQFIGKVGLAGLQEVFRLDGNSYEVVTNAIGGAAAIGFEEFLDGRVNFADVQQILMQGLDECIFVEIEKQMIGAVKSIQPNNYHADTAFNKKAFDRLLQIADSYDHATIYCTFEFAATIMPDQNHMWSDSMKNQIWDNGYLGNYMGHQVVVLPQSYEDETNGTKVIDPSFCWIIPTGANKPVKIAFEGGTIVDEYTNYDRSKEIQVYKKVGVRAIFSNDICVYRNTSLTR